MAGVAAFAGVATTVEVAALHLDTNRRKSFLKISDLKLGSMVRVKSSCPEDQKKMTEAGELVKQLEVSRKWVVKLSVKDEG